MVLLETIQLKRTFGQYIAIDGVSFQLHANEMRAIIGPNGAGKSTLINLITGLLPPTEGEIVYKGRHIGGLQPEKIAGLGISRSFQKTSILPGLTVFENIRITVQAKRRIHNPFGSVQGLHETAERAEAILDVLNLGKLKQSLAANLSHGEQRNLEIGIALATDPDLLFLDEPTQGMSGEETRRTTELISRVCKGRTVVLVEHDMNVVMQLADSITVLHQGRILAEGTPDSIHQNRMVQKVYLTGK